VSPPSILATEWLSTPASDIIRRVSVLDRDEGRIQQLACAAAGGDRQARARCVELAFPLLRGLARRYEGHGVSRDDLEQEIALGSLRALERYDPSRGTPFLAWARVWARQALQQALAEHSRPMRLTRHALWDLHELKSTQERLWQEQRAEPTLAQLADVLSWPQERISHVLQSGQTSEHPDALDLVIDPLSQDAFEDVITRVTARQLRPLLLALPQREREILERRAHEEPLRTIARSLGLSHQRVAALEQRALSKINATALRIDQSVAEA
jgi:RNA polymerase sigma factor (sigma-70 family)